MPKISDDWFSILEIFPNFIIDSLVVLADEFLYYGRLIYGKALSLYLKTLRDDFGNYWKTLIDFNCSFKIWVFLVFLKLFNKLSSKLSSLFYRI